MKWFGDNYNYLHRLWKTSLFFRAVLGSFYIISAILIYFAIDCYISGNKGCIGLTIILGMTFIFMVVVTYGVVYWSITTYHDDEGDDSFKQTIRSSQEPIQVKVLNLDADSFVLTNPMDSASLNSPESSKKFSKKSSKKLSKKSSKRRDSISSPDTHIDIADSFSVANPIVTPSLPLRDQERP